MRIVRHMYHHKDIHAFYWMKDAAWCVTITILGKYRKGAREERLAMLPTVTVLPVSVRELIGPV